MTNERAKNELRLLERALRATQNGVMITDATKSDDPIVFVNGAFEKITGYAPEEILGRNPRFLQGGDSDQPALNDLRASRRDYDDIEWTGVLRNYRKDGTPFYNELVTAAVRDEWGQATHHIGFVTDVTEREEAEERLRFQADLLDAIGQAVIAVNLSGRIAYWNRAAERLYGWPSGEAVGRPAHEIMVSEEQMERAGEIWAELSAGRSWSGEFVVRRQDGSSFPAAVTDTPVFDERRNLVGLIGVSEDITERKEAEEDRLRISQEYEEMVRVLPNVVFRCRRVEHGGMRLTYSEGALAQEFGVDTGQAAGRPLRELFPPEFLSTVVPAFERAFAGETVEFPSRIGDRSFANVAMPFRAAPRARGRGREAGGGPPSTRSWGT